MRARTFRLHFITSSQARSLFLLHVQAVRAFICGQCEPADQPNQSQLITLAVLESVSSCARQYEAFVTLFVVSFPQVATSLWKSTLSVMDRTLLYQAD